MIRLIIAHVTLIKTDRSSVQNRGSGSSARTGAVLGFGDEGSQMAGLVSRSSRSASSR